MYCVKLLFCLTRLSQMAAKEWRESMGKKNIHPAKVDNQNIQSDYRIMEPFGLTRYSKGMYGGNMMMGKYNIICGRNMFDGYNMMSGSNMMG